MALAQNRQNIASDARKSLETLMAHGNLALNQRTAAIDMEYRSYQDLEALKAEKPVLNDELRTLTAALTQAESAVDDLRKLYDGGRIEPDQFLPARWDLMPPDSYVGLRPDHSRMRQTLFVLLRLANRRPAPAPARVRWGNTRDCGAS